MKKITTKQLLKILPMSEEVRGEILGKFDSLSDDQKLEIKKLCWMMFFELLNDKIRHELDQALVTIEDEKKKGTGLYKEVEERVLKEFREKLMKEAEKETVGKVREELEKVVVAEGVAPAAKAAS